ncbi:hypothetical protein GE09DRAFT_1159821 [Coniochaeta sp. 2T2.1]|nr:hypothetical protein GE09DRAFT_1159821 [Coniochaeta sp. 2T2.1]
MRLLPQTLVPVLLVCVTGVLAQGPDAASTTPPTTPTLQVSTDGSCGSGLTCSGSLYGRCCSEHWFCGTGDAYCGTGCHAEFGVCEEETPSPAPDPVTTVTVTRTITAFATGLFTTTATVTGAVTRTVLTTAVSVVFRTDVKTLTQTQTLTTTTAAPVLSTSVIYSYSYITKNLTQVVLTTSTLTATGCFPTSAAPSTVTVTSLPPAPSPTLTGSPATCSKWYQVQKGETCATVASKNGVTVVEM